MEAAYNRTALIIKFGPLVNLTAASIEEREQRNRKAAVRLTVLR